MRFGRFIFVLWLGLLGIAVTGCKKSQPAESSSTPQKQPPVERVARVHWLGARQIAAETNSAAFLKLWEMPEGQALKSYILSQLAEASSRSAATGPTSVRPLLDDLVQDEFYLNVDLQPGQKLIAALAIHLDAERSAVWKTNLTLLKSPEIPDLAPTLPWAKKTIDFKQSGDWCFVVIGGLADVALAPMEDIINTRNLRSSTGFWLEAEVDLAKLSPLFSKLLLPTGLPVMRFAMSGNPEGVSTKAIADFPSPLPFQLEPWRIPTNIIHGPITSFTAIRGFGPMLAFRFGTNFLFGPPPNQAFCWSERAYAALTYLAVPVPEAEKRVGTIAERLVEIGNNWLSNNASGLFVRIPHGVRCTAGNPLMGPFLEAAGDDQQPFIVTGLGKNTGQEKPAPEWLLDTSHGQTNLLLYDREITGRQIESWLYLGQALRIVFWKSQLPADSLPIRWLKAAAPLMGPCTTKIALTGPSQITFDRSSSAGLNSIELHLLADWLESPNFPQGLHTTVAPGTPRHRPFHRTNAPPASVTKTNR